MPVAQEAEQLDNEEEYKPVVEETPVVDANTEETKPAMEATGEPMSDQIKEYVPEQVAPTETEKQFDEEARLAKQTLVDEINQFKPD